MTTIRIPTGDELRDRLAGVDRLLLAKKWERAAIVFAFTTNEGRGGRQHPEPPRMTMREFARQGYAGLTTNKSVERYRAAWVTAIDNGWATPCNPGDAVPLPEQPFPAWPYGMEDNKVTFEDRSDEPTNLNDYRPEPETKRDYNRRPVEVRVLENLDKVVKDLTQIESVEGIDAALREQLIDKLTAVLRALRGDLVSV